mmetsp:Transcript_64944/g.120893  ORF Transcript_64944/g.120893 Transcript_64944/m.120893 type:complete len:242 (-) Transcript_64944:207-932(-)
MPLRTAKSWAQCVLVHWTAVSQRRSDNACVPGLGRSVSNGRGTATGCGGEALAGGAMSGSSRALLQLSAATASSRAPLQPLLPLLIPWTLCSKLTMRRMMPSTATVSAAFSRSTSPSNAMMALSGGSTVVASAEFDLLRSARGGLPWVSGRRLCCLWWLLLDCASCPGASTCLSACAAACVAMLEAGSCKLSISTSSTSARPLLPSSSSSHGNSWGLLFGEITSKSSPSLKGTKEPENTGE